MAKAADGVAAVKAALREAGVKAKVRSRKAAPVTVADKAKSFKVEPGAIVRAELYLVGGAPVLVLLSGERVCREDQLAKVVGLSGDVVKASDAEVLKATGFDAKSLGPAGQRGKMPVAIDVALKAHEALIGQGGAPDAFLELTVPELKRVTAGIVSYALAQDM